MPPKLPVVSIIILNWNNAPDTLECLTSVLAQDYPSFSALVVDNGSADDSASVIRSRFPNIPVLETDKNLGYAGGNNLGMRSAFESDAEYALLLNDDTVLDRCMLSRLVETAQADARIGFVGPMVYSAAQPEHIQSAGGKIDRFWIATHRGFREADAGQFSEPAEVDWLVGCAIMVKRQVVERIGDLDVRFFSYVEELDWCVRARRAGYRIVHVPAARLWHKRTARFDGPAPYVTYYMYRNQLLLLSKHKAGLLPQLVNSIRTARTLASWSLRPKWRSKRVHRDAILRAVSDYWRGRFGPAAVI